MTEQHFCVLRQAKGEGKNPAQCFLWKTIAHTVSMAKRKKKTLERNLTQASKIGRPYKAYGIEDAVRMVSFGLERRLQKTPWWMENLKYFLRGTSTNRFCAYTNIVPAKFLILWLQVLVNKLQLSEAIGACHLDVSFSQFSALSCWKSTMIVASWHSRKPCS